MSALLSPTETQFPVCPSSARNARAAHLPQFRDSLTIVANYACEESQTPLLSLTAVRRIYSPLGQKCFSNAQTALIAKQKAPALFSHGAWNKSPLSQFS
jgi:hypothetical protein